MIPFLTSAAITTTLDIGSRGAGVTELQTFLARDTAIYPEGLVTGYYGTLTANAVKRYQCTYAIVCTGDTVTTGYGRVGPATRASINAQLGGETPAGDVSAPIMLNETIATTSTTATISWTTGENARSRVMYGTSWPFLYAIAPSAADSTVDRSTTVVISGLSPNATYFYVRESVDTSGNVMWTTAKTFRTAP